MATNKDLQARGLLGVVLVDENGTVGAAIDLGDVQLLAGTALIGKVGIDQTTPGTTNLVATISGQNGVAGGAGAVGATVQRVTLASDDPGVAALLAATPAGTNLIGRVVADASAATGGIPSTARLLSAAGSAGDATNVKASAGRVYAIQGANVATSARYLKLYNSATAPTAGAGTPVKTLYLPASSAFVFDWPLGLTFSTGIGFTLVTTSPDAGATSVTAADILALNIDYA